MTTLPQNDVKRAIEIELLALDLSTCGRCTGTARNLDDAIDSVARLLRDTGTAVRVTRHVVTTAEQAERLRFAVSPTIRINGRDIALETKESRCDDCGDLCGCEGGVDCRVWIWKGQEHLEAPKAMIIDALLKAHATDASGGQPAVFSLPENLRRFFAGMARRQRPGGGVAADRASADHGSGACCDRGAHRDDASTADCCGVGAARPAGSRTPCGCL